MSTAHRTIASGALIGLVLGCNAAPAPALPSVSAGTTPAPVNGDDAGAASRPAASTAGAAWKVCPRGMSFSCTQTSSGVPLEPGESIVCLCMHGCPVPQIRVVQSAEGTWPDGSAKGRMTCADSDLPSARPPDPMP